MALIQPQTYKAGQTSIPGAVPGRGTPGTAQPLTPMQPQPQMGQPAPAPRASAAPQGYGSQQMQQTVQQAVDPYQQQLQALDARIRATQQQTQMQRSGMAGGRGPGMGVEWGDTPLGQLQNLEIQRANLRRQMQQAQASGQAEALRQSELMRRENVRDELFGGARGRVDELRQDPTDALILQQLQARIRGESAPFTDQVRAGMFSQGADQAASAEQALLRNVPGQPGDPAYEAARRELMAGRQGQLANLNRDLGIQQQLANFGAQTQALAQGGAFNQARNAQITDAQRYLASLLGQETFNFGAQEPTFEDFLRLLQDQGR